MTKAQQYHRLELISLGLVLAAACLLSYGGWKRSRLLRWLSNSEGSIDNIYQLVPILQKNARALFLVFNDLASAINSVDLPTRKAKAISKEAVRTLLSQDWVLTKISNAQDAVLQEFGISREALDEAISRFRNDDQVRMYTDGVDLMYSIVLDGGYPHCPGVEICEGVTKQVALSIIEKVISAKRKLLQSEINKLIPEDNIEQDIVYSEMQRFGYTNRQQAYIAFKNTENIYQYDFDFIQSKQQLLKASVTAERSFTIGTEVPRITSEELHIMLETMEENASLFVMVFEDSCVTEDFVAFVKDKAATHTRAALAWMHPDDITPEYVCTSYPAAIHFKGGIAERIIYRS